MTLTINPAGIRDRRIADLKLTSPNYARWQQALTLRDDIIMKDGLDTVEYKDALTLIRFYSKRWKMEVEGVNVSLSDSHITERVEDMKREMASIVRGEEK